MKILHFISDIGIANGVMSVVYNYFSSMPDDVKFDIMYFHQTPDSREKDINDLGGKVYKIPSPGNIPKFLKALDKFFEQHKDEYSAVHIHAPQFTALIAIKARKYGIKKIISHCHTAVYSLNKKKVIFNKALNMPTRFMADTCIAPSDMAGKVWFKKKYILMKNAIDCEAYKFETDKRTAKRKQLQIENKFAVIQTGKTTKEQKNHKFTFRVFAELIKQKPDSTLLLAGGEKTEELDNMAKGLGIEKDIMYLGTRSDISELLMAADAFILPSTSEGLLIAAIEGQASGLAGIISDRVPKDVCITTNLLVMSLETEPKQWANKLIKISRMSIEREKWCSEVKKVGWDIQDNAKQLLKIYGG